MAKRGQRKGRTSATKKKGVKKVELRCYNYTEKVFDYVISESKARKVSQSMIIGELLDRAVK